MSEKTKRPTIAELESLLADPSQKIEILSSGEVITRQSQIVRDAIAPYREMLKRLEWVGFHAGPDEGYECCPVCMNPFSKTHHDDCPLKALLKED